MSDLALPAHIVSPDRRAIQSLVERLHAEHGQHLVSLALFGSKARGDDTADSDIDVLVVTDRDEWAVKSPILTLGARVSLEHDVLFNLYVIGQERWEWMGQVLHPLYRVILAEGIPLTLERV